MKIKMRACLFLGYDLTSEVQNLSQIQTDKIINWDTTNQFQVIYDHYSGDILFAGTEVIGADSDMEVSMLLPPAQEITDKISQVKEKFKIHFPEWSHYADANPQLYFINFVDDITD